MNRNDAPLRRLVGRWELTATLDDRVLSRAPVTFEWLREATLLVQRTEPQTFLVPEWEGAAPHWSEAVIGADDYSGRLTMLYYDAWGVSRRMEMALDGEEWTLDGRPGEDFHQRFRGRFTSEEAIEGQWQTSTDGRDWRRDFDVVYRRL